MKFNYFLGIDPGQEGAIALIDYNNNVLAVKKFEKYELYTKVPKGVTPKFKYDAFRESIKDILEKAQELNKSQLIKSPNVKPKDQECVFGLVEDIHAMPKQGVTGCFNFGFVTGVVLGVFLWFFSHFDRVAPATWKKQYQLSEDKALSKRAALAIFPNLSEDLSDDEYEALLLAHYAKEIKQYEYLHFYKG